MQQPPETFPYMVMCKSLPRCREKASHLTYGKCSKLSLTQQGREEGPDQHLGLLGKVPALHLQSTLWPGRRSTCQVWVSCLPTFFSCGSLYIKRLPKEWISLTGVVKDAS